MTDAKTPLSVYVHIPFCASKCAYCDFYSAPGGGEDCAAYAAALKKRLSAAAGLFAGRETVTIYFGGGTPVCMPPALLRDILSGIFAYTVSVGAEISLEANPGLADEKDLAALRAAGFNRISLGMQSALESELALLSRRHGHGDTVRAVAAARRAGFENLSLDLMLGLPGQTAQKLRASVSAAVALDPEHISAYILRLEPGTPMHARYPQGAMDDEESAERYLECCSLLSEAGYAQYEISNFAKPGFESRHNMVYWELGEYLGLGPGAHSFLDGRRFSFPADTAGFIEGSSEENPLAGAVFEPPRSGAEAEGEYIMLSLRTARGIATGRLGERAGLAAMAVLGHCEKRGLARKTPEGYGLTPEGFLISNTIISEILAAAED